MACEAYIGPNDASGCEYKSQYSEYSNDELKREYQKLNGKTDTQSRLRAQAVASTYK